MLLCGSCRWHLSFCWAEGLLLVHKSLLSVVSTKALLQLLCNLLWLVGKLQCYLHLLSFPQNS